jgi:hypothetical protein
MAHSHDEAQDAIEVWKVSPSFSDYEVSSLGRVRRLSWSKFSKPGRIINSHRMKNGYYNIVLYKASVRSNVSLHRLVCEAFHGDAPTQDHEAAHGDGVKSNNTSLNLRWATKLENEKDKIKTGTLIMGEQHCRSKLSEQDVIYIRTCGKRTKDLAVQFGVRPNHITDLKRGRHWKHLEAAPSDQV